MRGIKLAKETQFSLIHFDEHPKQKCGSRVSQSRERIVHAAPHTSCLLWRKRLPCLMRSVESGFRRLENSDKKILIHHTGIVILVIIHDEQSRVVQENDLYLQRLRTPYNVKKILSSLNS